MITPKGYRAKGRRLENEAITFAKSIKLNIKRTGMSGQLQGIKGDMQWIEEGKTYLGECKSGQQVPQTLYNWLEKDNMSFLVIKRDRKKRLWVLDEELLKVLCGV